MKWMIWFVSIKIIFKRLYNAMYPSKAFFKSRFTIENLNKNKCSTLSVENGRNGSVLSAWQLGFWPY